MSRDHVRVYTRAGRDATPGALGPVAVQAYVPFEDAIWAIVIVEPTGERLAVTLDQFVEGPKANTTLAQQHMRELREKASRDPDLRQAVIDLGLEWSTARPVLKASLR